MDPATHVCIIINPISGPARRGAAGQRKEIAVRALDGCGVAGTVVVTERPGHAYDLAVSAIAGGAHLVVAWGGDGTINEVARALTSTSTSLGIVPGGSGNGLARELGIPFDPREAIRLAVNAKDWLIDAGEMGGRLFFNIAGVGLDAHVAAGMASRLNHRGLLPYVTATARDVLTYRPRNYRIVADGQCFDTSALIVAVANSRQYGFGTRIAPTAALDDGWLDLVIVEERGLLGDASRLLSVFAGTFDRQPGVRSVKVKEVHIRSQSDMPFHVDGEVMRGDAELTVRVMASVVRIRAPASAPETLRAGRTSFTTGSRIAATNEVPTRRQP